MISANVALSDIFDTFRQRYNIVNTRAADKATNNVFTGSNNAFSSNVTVTGNLKVGGNASTNLQVVPKQQLDTGLAAKVNLTGGEMIAGKKTFSSNVVVATSGTNSRLDIVSPSANSSVLALRKTNERWQILTANTETGSANTGSNLIVRAHGDAGTIIGNAIEINRATRVVNFPVDPKINGFNISRWRLIDRRTVPVGSGPVNISWQGTSYSKVSMKLHRIIGSFTTAGLFLRFSLNGTIAVGPTDYSIAGVYHRTNSTTSGFFTTATGGGIRLTGGMLAGSPWTIIGDIDMGSSVTSSTYLGYAKGVDSVPDHQMDQMWGYLNALGFQNGISLLTDFGTWSGDILIEGVV